METKYKKQFASVIAFFAKVFVVKINFYHKSCAMHNLPQLPPLPKFPATHATSSAKFRGAALILTSLLLSVGQSRAAELVASDAAAYDWFGISAGLSGNIALVGADGNDPYFNGTNVVFGSAYVYRDVASASGTVTEDLHLVTYDPAYPDGFGVSVSLSGNTALVGADLLDLDNSTYSGRAYVYRNLDTATGSITENVKLTGSDQTGGQDEFGHSVSLSGSIGLVGAYGNDAADYQSGRAYVYRNLHTASGTATEHAILNASDPAAFDKFGHSVSLSGSIGLVGAYAGDYNTSPRAYVYRNLDTATGTVTQNAKLVPSDPHYASYFGISVSLSGNTGLIGAERSDHGSRYAGSAFLYRNLDSASGTVTESAALVASDANFDDSFGHSVSLSGNTALVGAYWNDDVGGKSGSAYVYRNLGSATGTVTEHVKLVASDASSGDQFGVSVSVDGDNFLVGAHYDDDGGSNAGKAYSGTISSVTTLDAGHSSRAIDGISFVSQQHWIIGENSDSNQVTLGTGDSGDVTAAGKAVYIGKNAGSDNNTLIVDGALIANVVYVGADGNTGNSLQINPGGTVTADIIEFASGSSMAGDLAVGSGDSIAGGGTITGDLNMSAGALFQFDPTTTLTVAGSVSLDTSFGIDDLAGLDSAVAAGTYVIIDGTSTDFDSIGIENWGPENAYDLGSGKSAYFSSGSLQVTVVEADPLGDYLSGRSLVSGDLFTDTDNNGYTVIEEYLASYGDGYGTDVMIYGIDSTTSALTLKSDSPTQPDGITVELLATSDLAIAFAPVTHTLTAIDNLDGTYTLSYAENSPPVTDQRFFALRISAD